MNSLVTTKIVSFGHCVPKQMITNRDLEKMMDTSADWIEQRSGIKERRWIEAGKETTLSMATTASQEALKKANLKPDDIDAIIFGCVLSDFIFPGTGCLLQNALGFSKPIPALDIRNACSGFLYALSIANGWILSKMYKRVLIVASEVQSTSIDKSTRGREIAVLFADGAGACIVEASTEVNTGVMDIFLASEGKNADKLCMVKPSPNDIQRISLDTKFDTSIFPYMDGKFVFKNAVTRMTECLTNICEKNKIKPSDLDCVIAHQANARINSMVLSQMGLPETKTHNTIDHYGNTTAATLPLTLNEAIELGKIQRGDLVALVAFGAGFTWGSALLRY